MNCPNCGASMRLDRDRNTLVCDYCRTETVAPMDEDGVQVVGETQKSCPVCSSKLSDGLLEGQSLLYCTQCHGMLIGMDKFSPLIETLRSLRDRPAEAFAIPDRKDLGRSLSCPLCTYVMASYPYAGPGNVNVDACEDCSVLWLDRNELRRIVMAPDQAPVYLRREIADDEFERA